ncbi:MAG: DUF3459 domain-containing protein [Caldilineales bacterium]|nr:DUF3459 domain-containing protein [Caldilineales bacterium]
MKQSNTQVMQDFVFGQLEADENTLAVERNRWSGIRHQYAITPPDPLPGQPVSVTVTVGRGVVVDRVSAYVTTDGTDPQGAHGQAQNGFTVTLQRQNTLWQPLYWDYAEVWQGEIPAQEAGTLVRYRIEGWHSADAAVSHWSREMNIDRTQELPTLYAYSVDDFRPPEWAFDAVVYQIFVDRFAPVESRWLEPEEMTNFHGGNLRGIIGRLDYIAELGVTAIWLTPIFLTDTYHAYDTIDFYNIDPRFGTKEDLLELVTEAHKRDLRVILDFVANHTSDLCPPFLAAKEDPDSAYRQWYSFDSSYAHGYRTFFTAKRMPQLNLDNEGARDYLIDAALYWLGEFGVDGLRLDYAAGPSHAFWSAFGAACKNANPDCWLFGEVTLGSDWLRTYAGRLDGCLDFTFTKQVRQLCISADGDTTISQFAAFIERTQRFFPAEYTRPTFIENHDMNRFLWVAGHNKARLKLATGLLIAFGGTPILYYGTEVGLGQPRPKAPHMEESRHLMLWGDAQDRELLAFFKNLIAARRNHTALTHGETSTIWLDDDRGLWLARRQFGNDSLLIAVNSSNTPAQFALPAGRYRDLDGVEQMDALTVAPLSVVILQEQS